jgi:hypothetical protein
MTEARSFCHTCNQQRPDAEVALCKRNYCTAQTALRLGKPKEIRPPQVNPGEVIDYTDFGAGIGDSWDKWTA